MSCASIGNGSTSWATKQTPSVATDAVEQTQEAVVEPRPVPDSVTPAVERQARYDHRCQDPGIDPRAHRFRDTERRPDQSIAGSAGNGDEQAALDPRQHQSAEGDEFVVECAEVELVADRRIRHQQPFAGNHGAQPLADRGRPMGSLVGGQRTPATTHASARRRRLSSGSSTARTVPRGRVVQTTYAF